MVVYFVTLIWTIGPEVGEIALCREFEDVHLRVNEKKVLNTLNKDKNRATIRYWLWYLHNHAGSHHHIANTCRFPMSGKIKSTDMKVNWWVVHQLRYAYLVHIGNPWCLSASSKPAWVACLYKSLPSTKTYRYIYARIHCKLQIILLAIFYWQKIFRSASRLCKCKF